MPISDAARMALSKSLKTDLAAKKDVRKELASECGEAGRKDRREHIYALG
jgi:hypothetical protein